MGNDLRSRGGSRGNSGGGNSVGNNRKLDKLKKSRERIDLKWLDTGLMLAVVERALISGGAVRFGLTRDGGALAVGVYGDGEYTTVYLNAKDDQTEFWQTIMESYT